MSTPTTNQQAANAGTAGTPPSLTYSATRRLGHQGEIIRMRADVRKASLDQVSALARLPGYNLQTAIATVVGRNVLATVKSGQILWPVVSALPRARSTLLGHARRFRLFGIDGLVDQKVGRCGRRRKRAQAGSSATLKEAN